MIKFNYLTLEETAQLEQWQSVLIHFPYLGELGEKSVFPASVVNRTEKQIPPLIQISEEIFTRFPDDLKGIINHFQQFITGDGNKYAWLNFKLTNSAQEDSFYLVKKSEIET